MRVPLSTLEVICAVLFSTTAVPAAGTSALEKGLVRYGLCPANIAEARVLEPKDAHDRYYIFVRLTKNDANSFATLTEQHAGETIQVEFDGAILERTVIHVRVDEGRMMLGNWTSREAANRMVSLLLDKQLVVPCGLRTVTE